MLKYKSIEQGPHDLETLYQKKRNYDGLAWKLLVIMYRYSLKMSNFLHFWMFVVWEISILKTYT